MRLVPTALLLVAPALAFAQGALTPADAPAPTMKSLDQIEPRLPLQAGVPGVILDMNGGLRITGSGSYYLTKDLIVASGNALTIEATKTTLDLNGFTLASVADDNVVRGTGISVTNLVVNLTIRNGHIRGSVAQQFDCSFAGRGFANGIAVTFDSQAVLSAGTVVVENVTVEGVQGYGIQLENLNGLIRACTVNHCGGTGLSATVVTDSSAEHCGGTAIVAGRAASNCYGSGTGGITAATAINCTGIGTTSGGVSANTAENCIGSSVDMTGLTASSASNCTGTSTKSYGLSSLNATGCVGASSSGTGLSTFTAANCTGGSNSGIGLFARESASGCFGKSSSGTGLFTTAASNCKGWSNSGTGLDTNSEENDYTGTAENCVGTSTSGHGLIASIATNCRGRTQDKGKIGVWISGTATGCRGTNTGASGTGAQLAVSCSIAVACTAESGTITGNKQLGTP